jgi:hypothetical protein
MPASARPMAQQCCNGSRFDWPTLMVWSLPCRRRIEGACATHGGLFHTVYRLTRGSHAQNQGLPYWRFRISHREPRRWAVSVTWRTWPRSMHPQCREVVQLPGHHRGCGIMKGSRRGEGGTRDVGEQAFMRGWGTAFAFSFGLPRSRSGADRLIGHAQNSPRWLRHPGATGRAVGRSSACHGSSLQEPVTPFDFPRSRD